MKKTPIFVCVTLGASIGLFATIPEGIGLKVVMMSIGALVGTAFGGAIARMGEKGRHRSKHEDDDDALAGLGVTPADLVQNYWRDKGRPPVQLSETPELEGDHMFDPDH